MPALAASNAIAALNDETYEYSSIVWALNGRVGYTTPYTDHDPDSVNWMGNFNTVPSGAVIVGIVHNHPDLDGIDDSIPSGSGNESGEDWMMYDQMLGLSLPRGVTVDSNFLLYIYSDEDYETHVYDNTDESSTSASCSLLRGSI